MIVEIDVADSKTEQVVDFLLRQNPLARVLGVVEVAAAVLDHGGPLQRHGAGDFIGGCGLCGFRRVLRIQRCFPLGCNRILVHLVVVASHQLKTRPVTE